MTFKVLKGGDGKARPCPACHRVITPGKKHKYNKRGKSGWCPGFISPEEEEARKLFVAQHKAIGQAWQQGNHVLIIRASKACLDALGFKY